MKIRNRLSLISSLVFGIVFSFASTLVYFVFHSGSENVIFNELEKACRLAALFYLEKDELPQLEYLKIEESFKQDIENMEIRVFDETGRIKYGSSSEPDGNITPDMLQKVRMAGKHNFKALNHYYSGIFYPDNEGDFVVFLKEDNSFFLSQANRLLLILVAVLFFGLIAIFVSSKVLSYIAYRPISAIIGQVNTIGSESLDQPIKSPGTQDELQDLIETFNNLLYRLSETFAIQKNFINYVSHEFKTPLTAIAGSLEVFAQRNRSPEEYKQVAADARKHVYQIEEILNTLMTVAGLKTDNTGHRKFRLDELLWDTMEHVRGNHPGASFSFNIHITPEKEPLLTVKGNQAQLQMALGNILENAVKYAGGKQVALVLGEQGGKLKLAVCDEGRGIPTDEIGLVTQAFYRGKNTQDTKGSGIGLSLSAIIFKQNNVEMFIESKLGQGTQVEIIFPAPNA